jgi:hypothetical protein
MGELKSFSLLAAWIVLSRYSRTVPVLSYRHYGLKYTIDSLCGLKFRHAVGSLIPAVGLKFILIQLYCTPYSGLARGLRHTVGC